VKEERKSEVCIAQVLLENPAILVRSSGVRLIKLSTQFLPVGFPPRSLSSLSAISCTCAFEGGIPRRLSSSTRCTIASSSSFVRRFEFGSQLRRGCVPLRRRRIVV
jgi:hypothetical protein